MELSCQTVLLCLKLKGSVKWECVFKRGGWGGSKVDESKILTRKQNEVKDSALTKLHTRHIHKTRLLMARDVTQHEMRGRDAYETNQALHLPQKYVVNVYNTMQSNDTSTKSARL